MYVDAFLFFSFFGVVYRKWALAITATLSCCNARYCMPLLFCMLHLTATAETAVVRIDTQLPAIPGSFGLERFIVTSLLLGRPLKCGVERKRKKIKELKPPLDVGTKTGPTLSSTS